MACFVAGDSNYGLIYLLAASASSRSPKHAETSEFDVLIGRQFGSNRDPLWLSDMTTVRIGLIVIGVALVCGGLILWPRAPQAEHEDRADGTMADVLRRLNETSDADPLK